jgi:hypothetical protein
LFCCACESLDSMAVRFGQAVKLLELFLLFE